MVTIYLLYFKEQKNTGYIGITTKTLKERKKRHLRESITHNTKKSRWLKKNINLGRRLYIKKLGECVNCQAFNQEKIYITKYKELGYRLYNSNAGGGGIIKHNNKTKLKISSKNKGRKLTPEQHNKLKKANQNKGPLTIEHCNNISKGKMGKKLSEYHKQRLRESHVGNTGKKFTAEHKDKISKANKGRSKGPQPEEVKIKRRGSNNKQSNKVIGINLVTKEILEYNSGGDAYRDLKNKGLVISRAGIYKSISGVQKQSGGYKWSKVIEDYK